MAMRSITPFLQPGRKTWAAFIEDSTGKAGNRSLGTKDRNRANSLCSELEDLVKWKLSSSDPGLSLVTEQAYLLYYGKQKPLFPGQPQRDQESPDFWTMRQLQQQVDQLKREVEKLRGWKTKYDALARSVEGRRELASRKAPTIKKTREAYFEDVKHLCKGGSMAKAFFGRFAEHVGEDTRLTDITAGEIAKFIQNQIKAKPKDSQRGARTRADVTRYFGWAARTYSIPTPLEQLPKLAKGAVPDISWHSLKEIEAAIKGETVYWRAIIATMAYAGLSAHELRGLRREDIIDIKGGNRALRVTPHKDRTLKSSNRKRSVMISPRLAPILDAHLAELPEEAVYLFPAEAGTHAEGMWLDGTFTRHLGTHLPAKMNALSLRRTFGSLLIRSGKNEVEVAAAMGNTPVMVRRHYARLLGGEIDVDF